MKVAIIIPTMNRPEFLFRQFEFYQSMNSPHPIYILDSSNDENAKKLKNGISKFKKLKIQYQWTSPGEDKLYSILTSVKEKYCIQMGDDDLLIPQTMSECADFLEANPEYATCAGKQTNIRFKQEDYNKPYGEIERATLPMGRSIESETAFGRLKDFWQNPNFICFSVRRIEHEIKIRNISRSLLLMEHLMDFFLWSSLIAPGKTKILNRLGYVMQINNNRYGFSELFLDDFLGKNFKDKWEICKKGLAGLIEETGVPGKESLKMATIIFCIFMARIINLETKDQLEIYERVEGVESTRTKKDTIKKLKYLILGLPLMKKLYFMYRKPEDVMRPESPYHDDFKKVSNFLRHSNIAE